MATEDLKHPYRRVVGAKQTLKKVQAGQARAVYVADDADQGVVEAIVQAAEARGLPIHHVATMEELGRLCGIQVGAAAAAETAAP